MYRKVILSVFTFFITSVSIACTCGYSEEFNLLDYDSYEYIFEVKIESKYEFKKDTVKSDIPKPPSLYEFGLLNGYNISILEIFKGELELTEKIMGFPSGSSCSWTPEIGVTYIFYTNSLNDVEACNRKLIKKYGQESYENEKSILQSLKTYPKEIKIKSNDKVLIEGNYVEKKREGIWKIYSTNEQNSVALILNYTSGQLLSIEKEKGYSDEDEWLNISYRYYLEQVKNKNENTTTPKKH